MATEKITVTVPQESAARIREQVRQGRTESVSAFVTTAIEDKLTRQRRARAWLDRALAEARSRDPQAAAEAALAVSRKYGIPPRPEDQELIERYVPKENREIKEEESS